ncbi:multicopper oxidase domain-containing protein [Nocardia sp. CDC153]|uniref:multicopper oxidase family protein n=1 Tax=Nocardia sp. CDC153 TaxID=3112167 RepID=UPI002DBE3B6B|nr:multicopper oxidase domain-containing protein [Nocardia sp. CDC153]MEC3953470.1 multicopper oxidase domain-containing protein [Nocardia sp. CDC153]
MPPRLSRRTLFRAAAALGVAGAAGAWQLSVDSPADRVHLTSRARLPEPFTLPLTVPPVLAPERRDDTTDYYRIVQRAANVTVLPGYSTPIWGYNGIFPGPTIVSNRARRTVVTHRNELPVPVVVHLHGGHVPEESDGYPTDLLYPVGGSHEEMADMMGGPDPSAHTMFGERDYTYPDGQPAAALWYHDHRMDFTGPAVWRGLAGFHLVVDDAERRLGLPGGARDLPLMLADRAFDEDGAFTYPAIDPTMTHTPGVTGKFGRGVLGDVVLVNGVPWPAHRVDTARYRLRLLNGSNARVYRLRFDRRGGSLPIVQIGSDGGLLARPRELTELTIAPGERYDVVVDFSDCAVGDQVTVYNDLGAGTTTRVLRFDIAERVRDTAVVPDRLTDFETLDRRTAVATRRFAFRQGKAGGMRGWVINGRAYDPRTPIARPTLGQVEVWQLSTDLDHPIHLHLNQFQVLTRDGRAPRAADGGWKDTLYLPATGMAEIAVRFTDYAGRFVLHCHNLEHEDMAMMATFGTVAGIAT